MRYDLDSPVPLIADMSSDIFSRPVDVSKYNCIYAGAQKKRIYGRSEYRYRKGRSFE